MPRENIQIPGSAVQPPSPPGKPIISDFPTPDLRDRIYVVLRDSRLAENATPPEKGSKFTGPDAAKFEGWTFSTRRPADQVGWVQDFYLNERQNQEEYNFTITYPYNQPDAPRIDRTYVFLREDFENLPTPDLSERDPSFPQLVLVDYKQVRLDDQVLDGLFIGLQKSYEPRPVVDITGETSEVFGFGGVMQRTQTVDIPGSQAIDEGLTVVDSKTSHKGLNTEIKETLQLAGADEPFLELTAGGSGYATPPAVSFGSDVGGLGGGAGTAHIATVGSGGGVQTVNLVRDSFGDTNGLFYFIGKLINSGTWINPCNVGGGIAVVTDNPPTVGAVETLFDRQASNFQLGFSVHPYVVIDVGSDRTFLMQSLDLRQRSDEDGGTLNINLSASNDLSNWDFLAPLQFNKTQNKWVHFPIGAPKPYRYYRLKASDPEARRLTFGEIEFYGTVQFTPIGAGSGVVTSVTVDNPGNYISTPVVSLIGGGGIGASAVVVLSGANIGAINVINGGFGYTGPPTVQITGGQGSQASAHTELGFEVDTVTVDDGGAGYVTPPAVHFDGDGAGAQGVAVLGGGVTSVDVSNPGSGYTSPPSVGFSGGGGTGAAGTAVMGFPVASVVVDNPGSGYTSEPTVTPSGGSAILRALRGLPVLSVNLANGGSGWSSAPTVVFTGDGAGAAGSIQVGYGIDTIPVDAGGSGYTAATVVISGDGSGAAASAIITGGVITSIVITNPGSGYTSPPSILISGDGSGAAAHSTLLATGTLVNLVLTSPGTDYTTAPTISFSGGGGSGAVAGSTLDTSAAAPIAAIIILSPGTDYTIAPTLSITGGGGTGAAAHAVLSTTGDVVSVTVTAPGTGYTHAPDVAFTGGSGTGAAGTANLGGGNAVSYVAIVNAGSGYTTPPTVSFLGGGGSGAAAHTTLKATGSVIALILDIPGNYTVAPTVIFTGGGGTGAAGIYHLSAAWPVLYEVTTDPVEKIVVNVVKKLIDAGSKYPGEGWVDVNAVDKWRSIQLTSSVDLRYLPPAEIVPTSHALNLPDILVSVDAEFGMDRTLGWKLATGFKSTQAIIQAEGDIRIGRLAGFNGMANGFIKRQFFFGPPDVTLLPCTGIIRPSSGAIVLRTQIGQALGAAGTTGGHITIENTVHISERVQVVPVNGIMTAGLTSGKKPLKGPIILQESDVETRMANIPLLPKAYVNTSSSSDEGMVIAVPPASFSHAEGQAILSINIPPSFPAILTPGAPFLRGVEVEKWRFGLFVMSLIYVFIPDEKCIPLPPPAPPTPSLDPIAWWPFESD